jgi:hypothetical protein
VTRTPHIRVVGRPITELMASRPSTASAAAISTTLMETLPRRLSVARAVARVGRGRDGRDLGQGGDAAEEQHAGEGLAEAGAVGDGVEISG